MAHNNNTNNTFEGQGTANQTGAFTSPATPPAQVQGPKRLYRTDGPLGGVSAGLADYTGVDAVLVRLAFVAMTIIGFPVIPLCYLAAWIIIPRADMPPVPPIMAPAPQPQQQPAPVEVHPDAPAPSPDSLSAT